MSLHFYEPVYVPEPLEAELVLYAKILAVVLNFIGKHINAFVAQLWKIVQKPAVDYCGI